MNATTILHFIAFDSSHKSAATVVFVFALFSSFVLSIVLLGVVWIVSSVAFKRAAPENLARELFFFRSQLGQYACSLLLSKWISCLGGLIAIKWVNEGGITTGPSCSTQGVLYEVGEFGSAFFVVVMGLHTFNTLVLRNRQPQWVGPVVTTLGWVAALAAGTGPLIVSDRTGGPLYNIGSLSCGFSRSSPVTNIVLFLVPMLVGSLLSAIVYSLIFLILRGTITINGGLRFQLDPERRLRLRNVTFEEYQSFVYSVARTMLWLPTTFVIVLFPSVVVQSMKVSGMHVGTALMAFSYILVYLDGIFNVLILFTVLRVLGFAVKSPKSTPSSDPEKGQSKLGPISRPTYNWDPQSTFAPPSQTQIKRTAPPARPPRTILQESALRPLFLTRSPFQPLKKTVSTTSSTRLLTSDRQLLSRSSSVSLNGSDVSDAELSLPPLAIQRHPESGPLQLRTADSPQNGLTPYSPPRHHPISGGLSPIPGSPSIPQSAAPSQEVTWQLPAVNRPPSTDGISSLVNLYFSRKSPESSYVSPAKRVSAALSVGPQAVTHHEGVISHPEPALSIGAVGGRYGRRRFSAANPDSPPAPVVSPTNPSQYSGTEAGSPPPLPSPPLPILRPTQPLRVSKVAMVNARPSISSEHRSLDSLRTSLDRPVSRALPLPPSLRVGWRSPSVFSQGNSTAWTHTRQGSSSSYLNGYI